MPEEKSMENPLAIIGHEDVVMGFQALGFKVYPVKDTEGLKATLGEVLNKKIAVCLVQDDIYNAAQDEINNYRSLPLPIFVPFAKGGKTTQLDKIVKDIRLRATGTF